MKPVFHRIKSFCQGLVIYSAFELLGLLKVFIL